MKQKKNDFLSKFRFPDVTIDPTLDEKYRDVIINPEKLARVNEKLKKIKNLDEIINRKK